MLQLDAAQVAARLDRLSLIDALERAFRADCQVPHREHHRLGEREDMLLIMPAWRAGGCIGIKLVTVFPGNSTLGHPSVHGTYSLFDGSTGIPLASLDGTELTRRRTAAASALAARYLARQDASRLLMVGTGALAPHVIESHCRVRPITAVRIWGRRSARAATLARELAGLGVQIEPVEDLESAVRWADIVSCATLTDTALIEGAWLHPGQHLDLIGAFTPAMREADDAALRRASIYIDSPAALTESGELVQALASGAIHAGSVRGELRDLVLGHAGRRSEDEITLFKSVGSAIEDLAAAELAVLGR